MKLLPTHHVLHPHKHRNRLLLLCLGGMISCAVVGKPLYGRLAGKDKSPQPLVENLASPPRGPFGFSLVGSQDAGPVDIEAFQTSDTCAECHPRQWQELNGSAHSIAHRDLLYRRTAELAREEAGEEVYAYCSGCHTPQGVASRLVPKTPESELPEVVKAGVVCDTCHQISALTGHDGPWKEPGNASVVLAPDPERKFGPPTGNDDDADHGVESRSFLQRSEFCASCHTVIHPLNGIRIEHTYAEWKDSIYARKNIQCQDCHMRSVEQARQVAENLTPLPLTGRSTEDGDERPIARHFFVGGNSNIDKLGGAVSHAEIAAERLRSAARLEIEAPNRIDADRPLEFAVLVTNIGAGHHLPTSLTELREMWVELNVVDAKGHTFFTSGRLDNNGDIEANAMRFGAQAADANGKLTYKPWEIAGFLWKRLIPAKETARDSFRVALPPAPGDAVQISATLWYRSAPPKVVRMLLGDQEITFDAVIMATATASVMLAKPE